MPDNPELFLIKPRFLLNNQSANYDIVKWQYQTFCCSESSYLRRCDMIVDFHGWRIPLTSVITPKRSHGVDIRIAEIDGVEKLVIVLDEDVTDKQLREAAPDAIQIRD